jgi:hypothetical protein
MAQKVTGLARLNDLSYKGGKLLLRIEANTPIPKKEYMAYLKEIKSLLETETGDEVARANHWIDTEIKYHGKTNSPNLTPHIGSRVANPELRRRRQFEETINYTMHTLMYIKGILDRLLISSFNTQQSKQRESVSKILQERLAGESTVIGNPMEPSIMEKITSYMSRIPLSQSTKERMVHQSRKKKKKKTRKKKKKKPRS